MMVPYSARLVLTATSVLAPFSCSSPIHSRKYFSPGPDAERELEAASVGARTSEANEDATERHW